MKTYHQYVCRTCKQTFDSIYLNKKYCSRVCYLIDKPNTIKKTEKKDWKCLFCGKEKKVFSHQLNKKYCSNDCKNKGSIGKRIGEKSPNWKDGYTGQNGYHYSRDNGKYNLTHRMVYEKHYGIRIPKGFNVHHIDGNRKNNDISNLQLISQQAHTRLHALRVTDKQIEELKVLYATGKYSHKDLAEMVGLDKSQISRRFR